MRIPRLYHPGPLKAGTETMLDAVAARHATRVLRLKSGDAVVLFDGAGHEAPAAITSIRRNVVAVEIDYVSARDRESPLAITLVQGISRGERMDFTIQKATELGVARIVPVITKRTVVKLNAERAKKRLQHWRGVAISACEQCGRNKLPLVDSPIALAEWIESAKPGLCDVLLDGTAKKRIGSLNAPGDAGVTLAAGPEGGLTEEERNTLIDGGFTAVALGPRTLRTETAALAAISVLQQRWGDL